MRSCAGEPATVSARTLAGVYIGTIIGAGFASGQEVLQFFALHGAFGLGGLAVATAVLSLFGYLILRVSCALQATTHAAVLNHVAGPVWGRVIDTVLTFFLFGAAAAMFAGAGATLQQQFGLPFEVGLIGMALLALATVLYGIQGVIRAVSFLVPILLIAVLGVSLATVLTGPVNLAFAGPARAAVPNWALSGVIYGSYNLVMAVSVLVPTTRLASRRRLLPGAIGGGVVLGLGALGVYLTILAGAPEATVAEVPMLLAAGRLSPVTALLYTVALLAAIYTTAVGALFGFVNRILGARTRHLRAAAVAAAVTSALAGRVGFSSLVATLFPAVGYAGLVLLGALALAFVRRRI